MEHLTEGGPAGRPIGERQRTFVGRGQERSDLAGGIRGGGLGPGAEGVAALTERQEGNQEPDRTDIGRSNATHERLLLGGGQSEAIPGGTRDRLVSL
ncbi:MAG: hypothetical protein ACREKB_15450, partial [Candidatus Rokuibacteriota bacterium]